MKKRKKTKKKMKMKKKRINKMNKTSIQKIKPAIRVKVLSNLLMQLHLRKTNNKDN